MGELSGASGMSSAASPSRGAGDDGRATPIFTAMRLAVIAPAR